MFRVIARFCSILLFILVILGCGGGESSPSGSGSGAEQESDAAVSATAEPLPTPTETFGPTPEAAEIPTPVNLIPTVEGTVAAEPSATAITRPSPTPLPTSIPTLVPSPTPTLMPTPVVTNTIVDAFGFDLTLDGEVSVESSGLTSDSADNDQGSIVFESGGSNVTMLWFQEDNFDVDGVLSDIYTALTTSQSARTFSLINEGNRTIDEDLNATSVKYLTFASVGTSESDQAGGITASWKCDTADAFSLTVTGGDAAVVQIRFKRILDGFSC